MLKRFAKKELSFVLVFVMLIGFLGTIPIKAFASQNDANQVSTATKKSEALDENGKYKIEICMPGKDPTEKHDEIIIMVDGSYSTNNTWPTTRRAILEIGKSVLEGDGKTLLTIMTFGAGDNIVLEHVKNLEELDNTLPSLPEGLLYGRSATNCEAGFTGIQEYLDTHANNLNEVYVVYMSDGNANTDETAYVFYDWKNNEWLNDTAYHIALTAINAELRSWLISGTTLSNANIDIFGERTEENNYGANVENLEEKVMLWAERVWHDVYEYSGMNPETAYALSDAERAFVKYDKENNTYIQNLFYLSISGRKYPNAHTNAYNAGISLAANEKVTRIYMIDSDSTTAWMANMSTDAANVLFYESGSTANLIETVQSVLTNLTYSPYNDVIITDYMSKWVNFAENTAKVINNKTGQTIWTSDDGWLIDENRPTSKASPVVIESVSSENYADGGTNVVGNQNGTIYKITWYVKDGAMVRNDNFSLIYEIDVDIGETGFEYNINYPANGKTTLTFTEKDGDSTSEKTEDIPVPDVIVNKTIPEVVPTPVPPTDVSNEKINIMVTKIWQDCGNENKRPESITIHLWNGNTEVASQKITAAEKWIYVFKDLEKYDQNQNEILYTVTEDSVDGYTTKIEGYNITNIYQNVNPTPKPEEPKPTVTPVPTKKPDTTPKPEQVVKPTTRPDSPNTPRTGYGHSLVGIGITTICVVVGVSLCIWNRTKKEKNK